MRTNRIAALAALTVSMPLLQGCIVRDIRDQMTLINERMYSIDRQLDQLADTNTAIENAVVQTASVDSRIGDVEERLAILESIDTSLKNLDVHLASLRDTISNIDATIPFLSLSGGDDEEGEDAEEGNAADDDDGI